MTLYRKHGRAMRLELHRGQRFVVQVEERGCAAYDETTFDARPDAADVSTANVPLLPDTPLQLAPELDRLERAGLLRLIAVSGESAHQLDDDTHEVRRWRDQQSFIHCALIRAGQLVELNFGGTGAAAQLLQLVERLNFDEPCRLSEGGISQLVLEPHVSAAIWPLLASCGLPSLPLRQLPRPDGRDGNGEPIAAIALSGRRWPNFFRPSYRNRAIALPHDVSATLREVPHDDAVLRAVAHLSAPAVSAEALTLRLLLSNGELLRVTVSLNEAERRFAHIEGSALQWFPSLAGAWGAATLLRLQ